MNNRARKKATVTAVISGLLLLMLILPFSIKLLARDSLPGIAEKVMDISDREDTTYQILEIVPDRSLARIGYYFDGQEPFQVYETDKTDMTVKVEIFDAWDEATQTWKPWQSGLENFSSKEEREIYVNYLMKMIQKENPEISDLITVSGNTVMSLDSLRSINGGTISGNTVSGNTISRAGSRLMRQILGSGTDEIKLDGGEPTEEELSKTPIWFSIYKEVTKEQYEAGPSEYRSYTMGGGNKTGYFHFVDHYEGGENRFQVNFGNAGALTEEALQANKCFYLVDEATLITDPSGLEWVSRQKDNVYAKGDDGVYRYAGPLESHIGSTEPIYYIKFVRAETPAVNDGKQYYVVNGSEASADGPYMFEFLTDEGSKGDTVNIEGKTIYYEGGFTNREWFKRYALDMEEDTFGAFHGKVSTMTIDELNTWAKLPDSNLGKYDFIVFQDGVYEVPGYTPGDAPVKIQGFLGDTNKIDVDAMGEDIAQRLFDYITRNKVPVILDSSIVFANNPLDVGGTGVDENGKPYEKIVNKQMLERQPNLWKLSALLLQNMPDSFLPAALPDETFPPFVWDDTNKAIDWKVIEDNQNFVKDLDKNYVNRSVYAAYGKTAVNRDFEKNIWNDKELLPEKSAANMEGFADVLLEIENENMYREADSSWYAGLLPTDVKESTVIRYIINYAYQRAVYLKSTINILDIEPCYPDDKSFPLTPADVIGWLAQDSQIKEKDIKITTMSVSEFIGKNEDLNEKYDLIYIGTDVDKLNLKSDSDGKMRTVFNDKNMNNLVYFHTGDRRINTLVLGGLLDTEYDGKGRLKSDIPVRFGGLDLTKNKVKDLESYAAAYYPIVLADEFYTKDANDKTIIDKRFIDDSSYMYQFANKMLEENRKNVFSRAALGGTLGTGKPNVKLLSFYLNRPKLSLKDWRVISDGTGEGGVHNISEKGGQYTLEYQFTINNIGAVSADTRYKCDLFIDVNADGKFSPQEQIEDISVSSGGAEVDLNNLKAGVSYTLRRRAPEGYKGVLTWKVKVSQNGNPNIRNSIFGYSKLVGMESETLNVLQICHQYSSSFNLEKELLDRKSMYYKLVNGGEINGTNYNGIKNDFDIQVKCMSISDFEEAYRTNKKILNDYNMLILGFSDMYGNLSTESINGAGGITEFIESGQCVLFAHDTTSFTNFDYDAVGRPDLGSDRAWAYNLNRFVRPLVGMDRYGVNELNIVKNSDGEVTSVSNTGRSMLLKQGKALSPDALSANPMKDIAYRPNSSRGETVPESHGYTYTIIDLKNRKSGEYKGFDYKKYLGSDIGNGNGAGDYNVTQVNEGQITTYPYELKSTFRVSTTHGQYYQLDMNADDDKDGETDLVVWYCLGGTFSGTGTASGGKSIYTISPNDVANNYFIYNKGNVTYTGMGHAGSGATDPKFVEEAKLFINTMVAAYSASIKPAEVEIVDEMSGKNINDLYSYYDSGNELRFGETESNYQKVYFTVNDLNFVKGKKQILSKFYLEKENGTEISCGGETYKAVPMALDVYAADKDGDDGNDVRADASSLVSGATYYVRIPRVELDENKTRQTFFVEVSSIIERYNKVVTTPPVMDKVDMVQLQLFELD